MQPGQIVRDGFDDAAGVEKGFPIEKGLKKRKIILLDRDFSEFAVDPDQPIRPGHPGIRVGAAGPAKLVPIKFHAQAGLLQRGQCADDFISPEVLVIINIAPMRRQSMAVRTTVKKQAPPGSRADSVPEKQNTGRISRGLFEHAVQPGAGQRRAARDGGGQQGARQQQRFFHPPFPLRPGCENTVSGVYYTMFL